MIGGWQDATPAAVSALVGCAAAFAVRGMALRAGLVSHPNPIVRQHQRPVAHLGGVALLVGAAAGLAAGPGKVSPPAFGWGALLFLALGVADDLYAFRPSRKLLLQLLMAAAAVLGGVCGHFTGSTPVDVLLSVAVLVLFVNAVNVTDVCDGLVAGLAVIALSGWGIVDPAQRAVAWSFAGASAGVLFLNRPPASLFLGDGGSHLVGFALGALSLLPATGAASGLAGSPGTRLAAGLLLGGVFLFETGWLTVVRFHAGIAPWQGSPDHFSLRLQARGWSRGMTDAVSWGAASVLAVAGVALAKGPPQAKAALVSGYGVAALAVAFALRKPKRRPRAGVGEFSK